MKYIKTKTIVKTKYKFHTKKNKHKKQSALQKHLAYVNQLVLNGEITPQLHQSYKGFEFDLQELQYQTWNMRVEQYRKLIDILLEFKPLHICELGSGTSTQIFKQYSILSNSTLNKQSLLDTIDSNEAYAHQDAIILNKVQISEYMCKNYSFNKCIECKFDGFEEFLEKQVKYDFVFIDSYQTRVQLLAFAILDKLTSNALIAIHDTERENVQCYIEEFKNILKTKNINLIMLYCDNLANRQLSIFKLDKSK